MLLLYHLAKSVRVYIWSEYLFKFQILIIFCGNITEVWLCNQIALILIYWRLVYCFAQWLLFCFMVNIVLIFLSLFPYFPSQSFAFPHNKQSNKYEEIPFWVFCESCYFLGLVCIYIYANQYIFNIYIEFIISCLNLIILEPWAELLYLAFLWFWPEFPWHGDKNIFCGDKKHLSYTIGLICIFSR